MVDTKVGDIKIFVLYIVKDLKEFIMYVDFVACVGLKIFDQVYEP